MADQTLNMDGFGSSKFGKVGGKKDPAELTLKEFCIHVASKNATTGSTPLFDADGEQIGMVVAILGQVNCIAANTVLKRLFKSAPAAAPEEEVSELPDDQDKD